MHSERGGEETAAGGQSVQRGGVSGPVGGHDAQAALSECLGAGPAGSLRSPVYLRNIIVIMVEMGLRPYRELIPMRKEQVDLENGIVHLPDSKTVNGIADMPMTARVREAFTLQMKQSGDSDYLFPSPRMESCKPHITTVSGLWDRTLKRAGLPHFSLYELRHTFATRLSAGGVADHFVTQMLRQGDSAVFKRYSQAKLNMMREALSKLDRQANEHGATCLTALAG